MVRVETPFNIDSWSKEQPREVLLTMANRSALRVFPFLFGIFPLKTSTYEPEAVILKATRCLVSAMCAVDGPTKAVRDAARAGRPEIAVRTQSTLPGRFGSVHQPVSPEVSRAMSISANPLAVPLYADAAVLRAAETASEENPETCLNFSLQALRVAGGASGTAGAADADAANYWDSVADDIRDVDAGMHTELLTRKPLWGSQWRSSRASSYWIELKQALQEHSSNFDYWIRWYEGFQSGAPLNWDIQEKIALLPDEDWEQGPEHIAEKIAEIEAAYLVGATPLAERIEISADTGRLRVVPEPMEPVHLYRNALETVRDEVSDIRTEGLGNLYSALAPSFARLDRTFEKYADSPQRVHDDFMRVHRNVHRLVSVKELPDDEVTNALQEVLDTGATDIRAAMPVVAEAVEKRLTLRLNKLEDAGKGEIAEAVELVADLSEPQLEDEWREDLFEVLNTSLDPDSGGAPELGSVDATYRLASRLSRSRPLLPKLYENAEKIGKGFKVGKTIAEIMAQLAVAIGRLISLI